jgi:hypothetical protein
MKPRILTLAVKKKYFDQIKRREKVDEFRLCKDYWRKRLEGKTFDYVLITLGYPAAEEKKDKALLFHWHGYEQRQITHEEFGPDPVFVYAIHLYVTAPLEAIA